jgi:hypothetical protein
MAEVFKLNPGKQRLVRQLLFVFYSIVDQPRPTPLLSDQKKLINSKMFNPETTAAIAHSMILVDSGLT